MVRPCRACRLPSSSRACCARTRRVRRRVSRCASMSAVSASWAESGLVPVEGGVRLSIAGTLLDERLQEWRAGRTIRMPALLREPSTYLNPGTPDERPALARRGIVLVGTVKSAALVEVVRRGGAWSEAAAAIRAWTRRQIDARPDADRRDRGRGHDGGADWRSQRPAPAGRTASPGGRHLPRHCHLRRQHRDARVRARRVLAADARAGAVGVDPHRRAPAVLRRRRRRHRVRRRAPSPSRSWCLPHARSIIARRRSTCWPWPRSLPLPQRPSSSSTPAFCSRSAQPPGSCSACRCCRRRPPSRGHRVSAARKAGGLCGRCSRRPSARSSRWRRSRRRCSGASPSPGSS